MTAPAPVMQTAPRLTGFVTIDEAAERVGHKPAAIRQAHRRGLLREGPPVRGHRGGGWVIRVMLSDVYAYASSTEAKRQQRCEAKEDRIRRKFTTATGRVSYRRPRARKTHCVRGHAMTADNVRICDRGDRVTRNCKTCERENYQKRKQVNSDAVMSA